MKLPQGHQTIMPYLMLKGAMKFIAFTQEVFNATITTNMHKLRENSDKVMHSEIIIGGSTIMFSDASEQWTEQTANMFVYVENADETYHKALKAGAKSVMELSDQDYGRTCGVEDPFGNVWWITALRSA
jgi:PhnB protein